MGEVSAALGGDVMERTGRVAAAVALIARGVEELRSVQFDDMTAQESLSAVESVEVVRRQFDRETDRLSAHVDSSGAYGVDGHRTAKAALKARGRVTGPEAHARLQCGRMLRSMPAVDAGYAAGDIPSESARAVARTLSNPRIRDFGPLIDAVVAEQAAGQTPEELKAWLRDLERVADVDGAEQAAETTHDRRHASLLENSMDSSWTLRGGFGALQGAAMAEILAPFEDAEFRADWEAAKAVHGDDTRVEHLARTPAQRRADAVFAIFRRAASAPTDAREPRPLVNVIVDAETFEAALRRAAGVAPADAADPLDIGPRRCQTVAGTRLAPSEALEAAVDGHVRRVVVDGSSTVIDVGRRRRLFTGCSRDAALLQAALRTRDRLRCGKDGCDAPSHRVQVDHDEEWHEGGRTDVSNSRARCGPHNLLKHQLSVGTRDPLDLWQVRRPE